MTPRKARRPSRWATLCGKVKSTALSSGFSKLDSDLVLRSYLINKGYADFISKGDDTLKAACWTKDQNEALATIAQTMGSTLNEKFGDYGK